MKIGFHLTPFWSPTDRSPTQILDEAIETAVGLSHRYIPARQLPDKAVSLLDTACARVAVSQHATPAEVEDLLRRKQSLEIEQGIIGREAAIGIEVAERQSKVEAALAEIESALLAAKARWESEQSMVDEILGLRASLRGRGVALDAALAEAEAGGELPGAADVERAGRKAADASDQRA